MVLLNKIKNVLRINYRKKRWPGLIKAYKQYLPVTKQTPIISLNEGNTPLILSDSISNLIGNGTKVFFKYLCISLLSNAGIPPSQGIHFLLAKSSINFLNLERAMGLEPTTFSLATRRSTTELRPLSLNYYNERSF